MVLLLLEESIDDRGCMVAVRICSYVGFLFLLDNIIDSAVTFVGLRMLRKDMTV